MSLLWGHAYIYSSRTSNSQSLSHEPPSRRSNWLPRETPRAHSMLRTAGGESWEIPPRVIQSVRLLNTHSGRSGEDEFEEGNAAGGSCSSSDERQLREGVRK